jgi:hypothetical protein
VPLPHSLPQEKALVWEPSLTTKCTKNKGKKKQRKERKKEKKHLQVVKYGNVIYLPIGIFFKLKN